MNMEVKITTEMLASRMVANYEETECLLDAAAEIELVGILGRDLVDEAYLKAKSKIIAVEGDHWTKCGKCSHCRPMYISPDVSTPSTEYGTCGLTHWKVRLSESCLDSKKGGVK